MQQTTGLSSEYCLLSLFYSKLTRLMRWWDRRSLQPTRKLTFNHPITSMELSVQIQRLVVTYGNTVAFIPAQPSETGAPIHSLSLPYAPSSASVHPIWQDRFVTGSTSDEWVRVHGIDGEEREVLKGHHGPVHCVEYSPDGEVYASGSGACDHSCLGTQFVLQVSRFFVTSVPPEDGMRLSPLTQLLMLIRHLRLGTIRLWQTTPGKAYGLWQGANNNG